MDTDIGAAGAVALADGILPADSSADWSAVNLYDLSGDTTWPITMFSNGQLPRTARSDCKEDGRTFEGTFAEQDSARDMIRSKASL